MKTFIFHYIIKMQQQPGKKTKQTQQQQQQQQQLKGQQQQLVQISKTSSTTSTTGKRKRQLQEQQHGKPSNRKRSKNITPLFPDSYASFREIPENFRTGGRNSYLIYFNLLNESWWYYPSFIPGRIRHLDVLHDVEDFPYHESAIYFFLMRDNLFHVRVTVEPNHEILTYLMGWRRPDEPIQTQRTYMLNISRVPGNYDSAWEFVNNMQTETNNRNIQGLLDLLLPFDEVHRQQRERQRRERQQRYRQRQQQNRLRRERLAQEQRQRERRRRQQRQREQQQNNPQEGD